MRPDQQRIRVLRGDLGQPQQVIRALQRPMPARRAPLHVLQEVVMEGELRGVIARGDLMTFIERPVSAALLAVTVFMLVVALLPTVRKGRDEVFTE